MIKQLAAALLLLPTFAFGQEAASGSAGELRILDKLNGIVTDMTIASGETLALGHLKITLTDCRYPSANPSGDAYAELSIVYRDVQPAAFEGWLIASAPALNAMEHPRYDVWVLRCMS